jgi:hypothetical protein
MAVELDACGIKFDTVQLAALVEMGCATGILKVPVKPQP